MVRIRCSIRTTKALCGPTTASILVKKLSTTEIPDSCGILQDKASTSMETKILSGGIMMSCHFLNKSIVSWIYDESSKTWGRKNASTRWLPFSVLAPIPEIIGRPGGFSMFYGFWAVNKKMEFYGMVPLVPQKSSYR